MLAQVVRTAASSHGRYRVMGNIRNPKNSPGQPAVYQIAFEGHLSPEWADWFGGLAITLQDNGDTLLTGPVADQAALYGLLKKVRDLGMTLLSVSRVGPDLEDRPEVEQQEERTWQPKQSTEYPR